MIEDDEEENEDFQTLTEVNHLIEPSNMLNKHKLNNFDKNNQLKRMETEVKKFIDKTDKLEFLKLKTLNI